VACGFRTTPRRTLVGWEFADMVTAEREGARSVGLVGVGAMGRGFGKNLLAAGYAVRGFDLDPRRLDELAAWGGVGVGSPSEAAAGAGWVITSLPTHEAVLDVALGARGIVEGAAEGMILIDTSTSLPEQSRSLGAELAARGIRFVDASVSGTGATVMSRDVVVLAGGDPDTVSACRSLFEGFSRQAYHLGPVGSGALAKLVINVAVVGNRLALAEALTFGIAAGMDPDAVLAILKDGPSYSRAMDLKGEKMIRGDYRPDSTLAASLHGCHLLLQQAQRAGAPLFLASLYTQIAQLGVNLGYADQDPASVIEPLLCMADPARRGRTQP
jgi:3-hydroxyisobutyrate dehydrogenase-like beta-hydroxyacid dehydrogenase